MQKTFPVVVAAFLLASLLFSSQAMAIPPVYKRSVENYTMPDVVLTDQDGKKVRLKTLLESDRPVVVEFIFSTCTTICPVLSVGFTNLQQRLLPDTTRVRLVSLSIDPENDTPKAMKEYLKRYKARPGWEFLTGSRKDIDKVMRAFDAWVPNKMAHKPLTFIRLQGGGWVRINGLMSTTEFLDECGKAGVR